VRFKVGLVALEDHARLYEAGGHSSAHQRDVLVEERREGGQSGDVVLVVLDGAQRHRLRQAGEAGVEAPVTGDRDQVLGELEARDAVFHLSFEDVVVDLLGVVEARAVDGVQPVEHVAPVRRAPLQILEGHRRQPIVVAVVSHRGRELWTLPKLELPRFVEQRSKVRYGASLWGACRRRQSQNEQHCRPQLIHLILLPTEPRRGSDPTCYTTVFHSTVVGQRSPFGRATGLEDRRYMMCLAGRSNNESSNAFS
jgi:hypothetical protein